MNMLFTKNQNSTISAIKDGKNVMITGPGGTGKTTIINHLLKIKDQLMHVNHDLGITAMTGAAAVLIGGTTLHSYLAVGMGRESEDAIVYKMNCRAMLKNKWQNINILVVDEVSMLPADLFDKLNRVAKRIRDCNKPFGGIQLVFAGDFLQLPCIKGDFCFQSDAWNECKFEIFHLTEIMRQSDEKFQTCLNRARFGQMTDEDIEYITQNDLKNNSNHCIKPTRILCQNDDVDAINSNKLQELPAIEIYKYKYRVECDKKNYQPRLHSYRFTDITKICNAQPTLFLSVGAQVMLLINLDVKRGLVNGSRGIVTRFIEYKMINSKGKDKMKYTPVVKFDIDGNGTEIVINEHSYDVKDGNCLIGTISQIPLKLAYAITVHKSQGLTLDSAIINLKGVFEYGQAYVALSRVKGVKNLFLKNITKDSFRAHPKALEFYRQLTVQKM